MSEFPSVDNEPSKLRQRLRTLASSCKRASQLSKRRNHISPQPNSKLRTFLNSSSEPSEALLNLITQAQNFQLSTGSLLVPTPQPPNKLAITKTIPISVFPTRIFRDLFEEALQLQPLFNELYAKIACDASWLSQALHPLLGAETLAAKLWDIHRRVREAGYVQEHALGIFRSDYMVLQDDGAGRGVLRQVEFNTVACAGIAHSERVSRLHAQLQRAGSYEAFAGREVGSGSLPMSRNVASVTEALVRAHHVYGPVRCPGCEEKCVLMLVQPRNVNVADELPFEYALWDAGVCCYRVVFGAQFLSCTTLTGTRELVYRPPGRVNPCEVSVAYLRAAIDEDEYDGIGVLCRIRLELSRAINCPDVLAHLATMKLVQERLASAGELEHFLSAESSAKLRSTFVSMARLEESEAGLRAQEIALNTRTAVDHVLKPSLEGGGHNVFGTDIPKFLKRLPREQWPRWVLMQLITPVPAPNVLLLPQGVFLGDTVTELGVVGTCLWKRLVDDQGMISLDKQSGFTLKTKSKDIREMSVVKGYGCFDSPCLFDG